MHKTENIFLINAALQYDKRSVAGGQPEIYFDSDIDRLKHYG
jgi:hypothetical protein